METIEALAKALNKFKVQIDSSFLLMKMANVYLYVKSNQSFIQSNFYFCSLSSFLCHPCLSFSEHDKGRELAFKLSVHKKMNQQL